MYVQIYASYPVRCKEPYKAFLPLLFAGYRVYEYREKPYLRFLYYIPWAYVTVLETTLYLPLRGVYQLFRLVFETVKAGIMVTIGSVCTCSDTNCRAIWQNRYLYRSGETRRSVVLKVPCSSRAPPGLIPGEVWHYFPVFRRFTVNPTRYP